MTSAAPRILLISAIFVSGLLAGMNVDRAFVAMPANGDLMCIQHATAGTRQMSDRLQHIAIGARPALSP